MADNPGYRHGDPPIRSHHSACRTNGEKTYSTPIFATLAPEEPQIFRRWSFDRSLRQAGLCMPTDAGSLLIRRERGWASQVSLRPLPVAFLDLEDVALGVAEIASAAARLSVPFDPGDLLHPARNKLAARGFNVGHHIPILVAGLVVRRLAAALDELEHTRFAEIELDPARAGRQFGQPQHLAVEPALRIKIPGIRPSPPRSACSKTDTRRSAGRTH